MTNAEYIMVKYIGEPGFEKNIVKKLK